MEELNEIKNSAAQAEQEPKTPLVEENSTATTAAEEPTAPTAAPAAETATPASDNEAPFVEPDENYDGLSREDLIARLNELIQLPVPQIKNRVAQLRNAFSAANAEVRKAAFEQFVADGGNKDDYQPQDDAVAETFHHLYGQYRNLRQQYQDQLEARKQENLARKQQILAELKALIDSSDTLKKNYDDFNALQDRWKAIGDVPRDYVTDLWQNYHLLVGQFFDKVRINRELKMLDMKKNLEQKISLCERAEELIVEPSVVKAFASLQSLREQWREIGPVPTEHNDEIWARFCNAANQVSTRHRDHFEQRRSELEKNLLAKQALVDQAAQLTATDPTTTRQWEEVGNQLDEMLKVWKTIGPVPREHNESIWSTFKNSIDEFYNRKRQYFSHVKDEQTINYNKKIDLCLQAEAIAKRDDWRKATDELLQLQSEWKTIGPVAKRNSEKVWARFRAACDEFFNRKAQHYDTLRADENLNLAQKEAILQQLKEHQFGTDKEENLRVIKDFQRRWMEVGFVPVEHKERLRTEFRQVLDTYFEQLKISARQADENALRERIRNSGDTRRAISGERNNLMERIEKLRNDIHVWDNNLGFLANSKQADLLKSEFEKKVQNARQQLALLEAKLRIVNTMPEEPQSEGNKTDEPNNE